MSLSGWLDAAIRRTPPASASVARLPVPPIRGTGGIDLRVEVVRGASDGPTLAVIGGVHGDEYEGIVAAARLAQTIDPRALGGRIVVVPVANPPAYAAGTRTSPVDGQNLARVFPGASAGTLSERIAAVLTEAIIRRADCLIDLHSAGRHYAMPRLCGGYAGGDPLGRRCLAAARAFGAPLLWEHPVVAPGRSLSTALDAGVPCVYAECGGGGRVRRADVVAYRLGVRRVMAHLGMFPRRGAPPPAKPPRLRLRSSGDTDAAIPAGEAGLLVARVRLLERVVTGQPLADILDADDPGRVRATVRADRSGVVVMARRTARVLEDEAAFLIAPARGGDHPAAPAGVRRPG